LLKLASLIIRRNQLAIALSALALMAGCERSDNAAPQQAGTERRFPVAVAAVQERTFEERVTVQGTVLPKSYAMVAPRMNGVVTDVFVEEGDRVEAGQTPLFQIDKEVVTQAYEMALQDLSVAECARLDGEAQVVAAQAQYDKAKLDHDRIERLFEQNAVPADALDQVRAGFTVSEAQLQRAKTAVRLYSEQEKKAAAAVEVAKKRLDDSLILSPISGFISYRGKKVGEYGEAGTPIIRVADTSVLEVSAFMPGEYYPRLKTGETTLRVTVSGIDVGMLPIAYKSPEISEQLRTFEVKCLVETPPEGVAPGAIAQVDAVLETRTGPGVPQDVIQMREGKSMVFVLDGDKAKAVEIHAGLATDGWTEVLDGVLAAGTPIIVKGYNLVNDGSPVDVVGEEK